MNELQQYKIPLIFGAIALVQEVLFVTIRSFKTFLLVLQTGLGFALGLYLQRTGIIDEFFNQQ